MLLKLNHENKREHEFRQTRATSSAPRESSLTPAYFFFFFLLLLSAVMCFGALRSHITADSCDGLSHMSCHSFMCAAKHSRITLAERTGLVPSLHKKIFFFSKQCFPKYIKKWLHSISLFYFLLKSKCRLEIFRTVSDFCCLIATKKQNGSTEVTTTPF